MAAPKQSKFGGAPAAFQKHFGLLLSVAVLWWVVRRTPISEIAGALGKVGIGDLALLVVIYLLGFLVRVLRSNWLLPQANLHLSSAGVFIGYAANNILPARLGEIIRAQVIGRRVGISRTTVFASVMVERIFDGAAIVSLLVIGSLTLQLTPTLERMRTAGIAVFSAGLLGVMAIGFSYRIWKGLIPADKRRWELLHSLFRGIELACRSPGVFLGILALSFLVWFMEAAMFYYGFKVFQIDLSLLPAFFVLGVVNLGVLLPSSPGGIGLFEAGAKLALLAYGVPDGTATVYGFVIHLCQLLPVIAIGLWYVNRLGFKSLGAIRAESADAAA